RAGRVSVPGSSAARAADQCEAMALEVLSEDLRVPSSSPRKIRCSRSEGNFRSVGTPSKAVRRWAGVQAEESRVAIRSLAVGGRADQDEVSATRPASAAVALAGQV